MAWQVFLQTCFWDFEGLLCLDFHPFHYKLCLAQCFNGQWITTYHMNIERIPHWHQLVHQNCHRCLGSLGSMHEGSLMPLPNPSKSQNTKAAKAPTWFTSCLVCPSPVFRLSFQHPISTAQTPPSQPCPSGGYSWHAVLWYRINMQKVGLNTHTQWHHVTSCDIVWHHIWHHVTTIIGP